MRAQGCRFLFPWCGSPCGSVIPGGTANSLHAAGAVLAPSGVQPAMAFLVFIQGLEEQQPWLREQ